MSNATLKLGALCGWTADRGGTTWAPANPEKMGRPYGCSEGFHLAMPEMSKRK
jgi:hypothetical protein